MSRKILKGKIVSDKMEKTVVVAVDVTRRHPIYGKILKTTRKFKARNGIGASLGDLVLIEESSPFSKEVSWVVKEILSKEEKE